MRNAALNTLFETLNPKPFTQPAAGRDSTLNPIPYTLNPACAQFAAGRTTGGRACSSSAQTRPGPRQRVATTQQRVSKAQRVAGHRVVGVRCPRGRQRLGVEITDDGPKDRGSGGCVDQGRGESPGQRGEGGALRVERWGQWAGAQGGACCVTNRTTVCRAHCGKLYYLPR